MARAPLDPLIDALGEPPVGPQERKPPSPTAEQKAANAEKALETLKQQYDELAANDISRIRDSLSQARAQDSAENGDTATHVARIFAVGHDIKGQAATFGYPLLTEVAKLLCEFLRPFQEGDAFPATLWPVVEAHAQAMEVVLTHKIHDGPQAQELLDALAALIKRTTNQS